MEAEWGRDVEFEIWQSIADFRCADFFKRYIEVGLGGLALHSINARVSGAKFSNFGVYVLDLQLSGCGDVCIIAPQHLNCPKALTD